MPLTADDRRLDSAKVLTIYLKLAGIARGVLVKGYSYSDIKRLIRPVDDSDEEGMIDGISAEEACDLVVELREQQRVDCLQELHAHVLVTVGSVLPSFV